MSDSKEAKKGVSADKCLDLKQGELQEGTVLNVTQATDRRGIDHCVEQLKKAGVAYDTASLYRSNGARDYRVRVASLIGVPFAVIYKVEEDGKLSFAQNLRDFGVFDEALATGWELKASSGSAPQHFDKWEGAYSFAQTRSLFISENGSPVSRRFDKGDLELELILGARFKATGSQGGREKLKIEEVQLGYQIASSSKETRGHSWESRNVQVSNIERARMRLKVCGTKSASILRPAEMYGTEPAIVFEIAREEGEGQEKKVARAEQIYFNLIGDLECVKFPVGLKLDTSLGRRIEGRKLKATAERVRDEEVEHLSSIYAQAILPGMDMKARYFDCLGTLIALKEIFANPANVGDTFHELKGFKQIRFTS